MKTWIVIALAATLCSPAFAQYELVKGSDSQLETIVGVYPSQDPAGSQNWVREYDGREFFKGIGIEKVQSYGYSGLYQYSFLARDLIINDEDVFFNGTYGNSVGVRLNTSAMLHRLARYPGANPELVGTPAAGGDPQLNLAGATSFGIDRRVNEFSIRSTPTVSRNVRVYLGNWEQMKTGVQQVLFRARQAAPGVPNGTKGSAAISTDADTSQTFMGFDTALGNASAVNYANVETKFGELAGRGVPGTINNFLPLNRLTTVKSTTPSQIFKARTKITDWMSFTGVQIFKKRNDTGARLAPTRVNVNSTNAALTMFVGDATTVTARYRRYNLQNETSPVVDSAGHPTNQALSKDERAYELEATYTGLPKTFMKIGYERRNTDRSTNPIHESHEEFDHPFTSLTTNWNIFRAGFRTCPFDKLNLNFNYESNNASTAEFAGTTNSQTKLDVNGTYMIKDNFGLFGNYNQWEGDNDQIRVPLTAIPTPAVNLAQGLIRDDAAGEYFNNKLATTVVGAWYALNEKLTFNLDWSQVNMDATALWVLGTDPAFLPHLVPDLVPFSAVNNQWSLGGTYAWTPTWRLRGSFFSSVSDGKSTITPSKYPGGLGPVWSPISVNQQGYSLGVSHDVSIKDSLDLDVTTSFFTDNIDATQSGSFSLWRLAWTRSY